MENHVYLAIDLKSFYASVECVERGLDTMHTHLVVADNSRTEKTICLAVSPSLKAYGIKGRARLFEVIQKVKEINGKRRHDAYGKLVGESCDARELEKNPHLALNYVVAVPRMSLYIQYSAKIYDIYLRYVACEDIHVYSIDEVFMDVTHYLKTYQMNSKQLAKKMIEDVYKETGIVATAGIGSNLYLCKVAMDIVAKHIPADEKGVRIAELDEKSYRKLLWKHRPLTDFWRVGRGYAKKLEANGMQTMGDVARCSLEHEDLLYRLFGINAELLIDHAWGYESCTMADIKAYKPSANSIGSGQVLHSPYTYEKTKLVVKEMCELMALDLLDKGLVSDQLGLSIGYDIENISNPHFHGETKLDMYGRMVPKSAHGTIHLEKKTSSVSLLSEAMMKLYDRIVDKKLMVRRINITANQVIHETMVKEKENCEQLNLFMDYEIQAQENERKEEALKREREIQKTVLEIKKRYGKNAVLKGMNLEEGATTKQRNQQIGGHKA